MIELSKPADSTQGSLRNKFPVLSSLSEHPVNYDAGKTWHPNKGVNHGLNRSKSLFALAQSFFKLKVDDTLETSTTDGYTIEPTQCTSNSSSDASSSAKALQYRDPLYYDHPTRHITPKEHNTWNPLASIRGKLDKSFFSVRGRNGLQPQAPTNFDDTDTSLMKRRKSLHGIHEAWGTVGKKFTLRGRKRGQAEAALSAYRLEAHEDIELPDLGSTVNADEIHKDAESLPSEGLSTTARASDSISVDRKSIALLDRDGPYSEAELNPITIPKSTNGKKRYGEERRSIDTSCSPKTLCPVRSRSTNKHVAFASATQLKLMEEAQQRQRVNSCLSTASGCPSLGSTQVSEKDLSLPAPTPPDVFSIRSSADYAEKTLADEQAEMDLIEHLLSDSSSITSVDLDVYHENRRNVRQARYNLLMDPVQQVKNFEIFTQVIENTSRMLANIGHADAEAIPRGMSFTGPVYTWTDANTLTKCDTNSAHLSEAAAEEDCLRDDGEGVIYYQPAGIPQVEVDNKYNHTIITTTELIETTLPSPTMPSPTTPATDKTSSLNIVRGRVLGRTPTKNLAVNNRNGTKSPLKRFGVRLTLNNAYNRLMENGSPSSTTAVRCPSRASVGSGQSEGELEEGGVDWSNFDLSYLSLTVDSASPIPPGPNSLDLKAFQAEEEAKFKHQKSSSDDSTAFFSAASIKPESVFSGILTPPVEVANPTPSPGKVKDFEELEMELLAFQVEEEAKYRKVRDRVLGQEDGGSPDNSRCCQCWKSCEKAGKCFEVEEKEFMDMQWKKDHWVEGYLCAKRGAVASEQKRKCSFSFVANGRKIRMATYGSSSFYAKTSSTPMKVNLRKEVLGSISTCLPVPTVKGKRLALHNGDDYTLNENLVACADSDLDSLHGSTNPVVDSSYPQPSFAFQPTGYTTAIPSTSTATPPTTNHHGNIVRCWSPPTQSYHVEEFDIRPKAAKGRLFNTLEWPPATKDIFRANYPISPPGPRNPVQSRNVDSGYWDSEKMVMTAAAPMEAQQAAADSGPSQFVIVPDAPAPAPSPGPSSAREEEVREDFFRFRAGNGTVSGEKETKGTLTQSTAACILSRLEDPTLSKTELDDFVDEQHVKLIKSLSEIGKPKPAEVPLLASPSAVSNATQTSTKKSTDKGKDKAPALPPRPVSSNWKGKAQAWPTFIALEPATIQNKNKGKAPALPPRDIPQLSVTTRNITPQATINGKGPVSPLTKAWLESKKEKGVGQCVLSDKTEEGYFSTFNHSHPSNCGGQQPGLTLSSGNNARRNLWVNRVVSGDGKTADIPAIRGMRGERKGVVRPSLTVTDRSVSGISVVTAVDEDFGEELRDFRDEEGGREGGERRVPSWVLYG